MNIVRSVSSMQAQSLKWKRSGVRIGFVPTMGYLHEGHLSLATRARREVGPKGKVVVSIYVNPTQFAPTEDLAKYPRDLPRDFRLCRQSGVDLVFVPEDRRMYAGRETGEFSTWVTEDQLTKGMEGDSRPTHFRGVTTVVAKLFNLVLPDVAVFGAKDYQQAAVLRRMVKDLNFPLRFIVAPTFREPDGLAMSSRNKYLDAEHRAQALVLSRMLARARGLIRRQPEGISAVELRGTLLGFAQEYPLARVDYIEFFHPSTLEPVQVVRRNTHMALAVFLGRTRLIDNARL